jgi:hypothetical protein
MKHILLLLIPLFLIVACRLDPMPRKAIEREKFVDVLVDVHLA